jgi:regulator of protease activity HflC (stomatin/prohibitin superfamily)
MPPKLTAEQRQAALAKAAEARRIRAEVKELLKTGSLTLPEVLARAETEPYLASMKISAILPALPGVGKVKAKRYLEEIRIAPNRKVQGLGIRQREALLERFS